MIRYNNTRMTLDIIHQAGSISRSEIARVTGMSPTSITRIVGDLLELGLVRETDTVSSGLGRKAVLVEVNDSRFHTAGVDIADQGIKMCLLNMEGELVGKLAGTPEAGSGSEQDVVDNLHAMYRTLLEDTGVGNESVAAIGVGALGTVDVETGTMVYADLLNWRDVPIRAMIESRFGKPAFVDNDIKCMLCGEINAKDGVPADDTVLLSFGRGVGGAIMHNGEMVRGVVNSAGELGHSIVDYTDGHPCFCGRCGCLAAFLTEQRIIEHARESVPGIRRIDELMAAFQRGEAWAIPQIDRICNYMAIAITNTVCYLNPSTIILGGKTLNDHPFLYDLAVEKYNKTMRYEPLATTVFKRSELKNDATCVGGAIMATGKYIQRMLQGPPSASAHPSRRERPFHRPAGQPLRPSFSY